MRYALVVLAVIAVLGAGRVYEWRGSEETDVPAIELRSEQPVREKARKRPAVEKEPKAVRRSETGASVAPAPVPVPAGDDDDGGDDDGGDD